MSAELVNHEVKSTLWHEVRMPIFAQPYPEGSDVFTDRAIGPQTEPAKKILVVTSWGGPLQTTGTSPSNRFSKGCIDWGLTATTMEATAASPAAPLAAGRDRRREEQGHCCQRSLTGARQDFLRGGGPWNSLLASSGVDLVLRCMAR